MQDNENTVSSPKDYRDFPKVSFYDRILIIIIMVFKRNISFKCNDFFFFKNKANSFFFF